jgi:hypothetical protein
MPFFAPGGISDPSLCRADGLHEHLIGEPCVAPGVVRVAVSEQCLERPLVHLLAKEVCGPAVLRAF